MKLSTSLFLALPLALTACDADLGSSALPSSARSNSITRAYDAPSADRYIVAFRPGRGLGARHAVAARGGQHKLDIRGADAFAAHLPAAALNGLRNHPDIDYIEQDVPRYPLGTLPEEVAPYGITMTQADQVSFGGATRMVCIIDSGYAMAHEDLQTSNVTASPDPGTGDPYYDDNSHGTHVAGTIAAIGGNGRGVRGVVENGGLRLHIVKVFTAAGWAYSSSLTNAAQKCADAGANVISMSLGGGARSKTEDNKFKQLDAAGVLSIAAAGNDGTRNNSYPASYGVVMSVAAVDDTGTRADFSQYNSQVEIAAPGVAVLSTTSYLANNSVTVNGSDYAAAQMDGAPAGNATGALVDGGLCDSVGSWSGKVVLCARGVISFYDKVSNAEAGGAVATVVFNNEPGVLHGTFSGASSTKPAIGISQADGQYLLGNAIGASATVDSSYTFPATNGYEEYDGTSMATPHVSGVAALVWSHYPGKTNDEIRAALTATAEDRGAAGRDSYYGYGIVKANAALEWLGGPTNGGGGGGPVNQAPVASFSKDCTDLGCSFNGSGSTNDGSVVGYAWDFGDGSTGTGITASHTYAASGTYLVTLTVTDDQGATSSASQSVSVSDGSVALTISNVSSAVKNARRGTFDIAWTTDLPATSTVTFTGIDSFSDGNLVTGHVMGFNGTKGATYEYTVSSTDAAGNTVTAGPFIHNN